MRHAQRRGDSGEDAATSQQQPRHTHQPQPHNPFMQTQSNPFAFGQQMQSAYNPFQPSSKYGVHSEAASAFGSTHAAAPAATPAIHSQFNPSHSHPFSTSSSALTQPLLHSQHHPAATPLISPSSTAAVETPRDPLPPSSSSYSAAMRNRSKEDLTSSSAAFTAHGGFGGKLAFGAASQAPTPKEHGPTDPNRAALLLESADAFHGGSAMSKRARRYAFAIKQWCTPMNLLKAAVAGLLLFVVLRLLISAVSNRGKHTSFSVVSYMRSMDESLLREDKFSYAAQYAAFRSWRDLVPSGHIILFADTASECAHLRSLPGSGGVQCVALESQPGCMHTEFRKPMMHCMLALAQQNAPTDTIIYTNADTALYEDLAQAVEEVQREDAEAAQKQEGSGKFVMVGRRTNTLLTPLMLEQFREDNFPQALRQTAQQSGILHSEFGIEVIVYTKKVMEELRIRDPADGSMVPAKQNKVIQSYLSKLPQPIVPSSTVFSSLRSATPSSFSFPPFLAGTHRWEHWLLSQLILDSGSGGVRVIDFSSQVTLVHMEPTPSGQQQAGAGAGAGGANAVAAISASRLHAAYRVGQSYNDALAKELSGNNYKIGTIDNAGYVLEGRCGRSVSPSSGPSAPLSRCSVTANPNVTDVVMFTKHASPDGYLVVLTVNHNYVALALNWVCWAERIHFTNYILIAEDQSSAAEFKKRGVSVIVRPDAPWIKKAGDYGSVEFQETMTFRTEFLMSVLHAGFHFVTADMDGLWLDNPLLFFNPSADLQGQMHKVVKISGGLVIVRATTWGKYFWQMVIECQRGNAKFLATAKQGTYEPASYTEQYCINELSRGLAAQPQFSRSLLDAYIFPDGKSFFDERNSQYRGIWPAIIHNNWIVGTSNKINRLHTWNLASANREATQCVELDRVPLPRLPASNPILKQWKETRGPIVEAQKALPQLMQRQQSDAFNPPPIGLAQTVPLPFDLKVRVLTGSNPEGLRKLLASLKATDFEGDAAKVQLEISIDHPKPQSRMEEVKAWNEVNKIAKEFAWNQPTAAAAPGTAAPAPATGKKVLIEHPYHLGLGGSFFYSTQHSWSPSDDNDNELLLVVHESVALSPAWFRWLKRVLLKYYAHPDQFDPRLMGISLTAAQLVLGETHLQRYAAGAGEVAPPPPNTFFTDEFGPAGGSQRTPAEIINRKDDVYKYQLFTANNRATLFLPQHWRRFQAWLLSKQVDPLTGVSNLPPSALSSDPAVASSLVAAHAHTPCIPTLVSNRWWLDAATPAQGPQTHYYAWLMRFVFEEGYYFLYSNYKDGKEVFAMDANLAEKNRGRLSAIHLAERLEPVHVNLPSTSVIPVYDFHFNHVSSADVLAWRRHIVAASVLDQCWTLDRLAGKIRSDEAAAAAEAARKAAEKAAAAAKKKAEKEAAAKAKKEKEAAEKKAKKEKEAAEKAAKAAAAKAEKDKKAAASKAAKDADKKKSDDKKKPAAKKDDKNKKPAAAKPGDKKKPTAKAPEAKKAEGEAAGAAPADKPAASDDGAEKKEAATAADSSSSEPATDAAAAPTASTDSTATEAKPTEE